MVQGNALHDVEQFLAASNKAESIGDLARMLDGISRDMGFDHFALIHHVDHRMTANGVSIRLENYPPGWVDTFLEKELYSWDPIHVASQKTNVAFAWSDVPTMIRMTPRQREVLEIAHREGLGDGFTVPAHVPGEANGSCSFAVKAGRTLPPNRTVMVQMVGSFAFRAARRLAIEASPGLAQPEPVILTPRQLECVALCGRGKTDGEIGSILGVSERTVEDHMDRLRHLYGVAKRVQVVLRAIHDGQIALTDLLR